MKKSVSVLLFLLLVSLTFLSSCSKVPAGQNPQDTAAAVQALKTGTQGVEISILANYPPAITYDQNDLIALVEVKNKGNYDLQAQDCFIQVTGFDQNIIGGDFGAAQSCSSGAGVLEGKKLYNTEGGFNQLEFSSQSVNLPIGAFDYAPTLNFLTCYNYQTTSSTPVCVDPLLYQITSEQKSCIPKDVGMAGGQGGPVSVSYAGVDMIGTRAIIDISISNFGGGRVLSPSADVRNCGQTALEYTDLDKVMYNVELNGGSRVDCKPADGYVRLVNNQGKIVCTFDINGQSAFETLLITNLQYGYIKSTTKNLRIVKTPE